MKTEIFGTFGPACAAQETLRQMIDEGMTGMRLNLSHVSLPASENYINAYKAAAKTAGVIPQILIDMQGPELRVGALEAAVSLLEGQIVFLCAMDIYKAGVDGGIYARVADIIPVPSEVVDALQTGDELLLDDGKILLQVTGIASSEGVATNKKIVKAEVLRGGILSSGKSIKIKDKYITMSPLTAHDIENIKLAKAYGVTALMQPFVLSGEDLRKVRRVLKEYGADDVQIFAKIENLLGVENLADILPEADVIVIARGDLGNDMPLWELPRVQKQIENACKKANKPYIVVTQMLASMEQNPVPTRAEVSDIFHAVYHGAWGVMVTGETAVGKYPVEVIRYLSQTAAQAEIK